MSTTAFVLVIQHLRTEFLSCFSDIRSHKNNVRLFGTPFDIHVYAAPEK